MREFLLNNKRRAIQIVVLLVVFFFVATYINGKKVYEERTKMLEIQKMEAQNRG